MRNQCISTVKETVNMKMGPVAPDDFMASVVRIPGQQSGNGSVTPNQAKPKGWNPVQCDTLEATIKDFVPATSESKAKLFVKVDIEGFEAELVDG